MTDQALREGAARLAALWLGCAAAAASHAAAQSTQPAAAGAEAPAPAAAGAEAPAPAAPPAPQPTQPTPEDEQALAQALAADQAAAAESSPGPGSGTSARAQAGGNPASFNPDLSFIADFALAYFSEDENLQTGGHDPQHTGFNLQQLELSVGSAVDPYFRFDANIVFAQFGVEIEEAYATTLDLPAQLQLRAGQFLTRFGRLNPTHPHAWDFVDQPFALGRVFGGEGNRGLGVELSWLTPLPWYVELVASATDAAGEATARSFFGAEDLGIEGLDDLEYLGAIKQFFPLSDDWSLATGLSSAFGPNATGRDNHSEVYGADVYLKWRPITYQSYQQVALHGEWFYRRRQVPEQVLQDGSGFAALAWRFAIRWAVAGRYEYGSSAVDTGFDSAPDYLDPEWTERRQRVAANTTFFPTEFSRLRLQGSVDLPGWKDDPIWAAFLAFELVTGAHGAHAF